jgi:hypothetical protein
MKSTLWDSTPVASVCARLSDTSATTVLTIYNIETCHGRQRWCHMRFPALWSSCTFKWQPALITTSTCCAFISMFDIASPPDCGESVTLVQLLTHGTSNRLPGMSWHSRHTQPFCKQKKNQWLDHHERSLQKQQWHFKIRCCGSPQAAAATYCLPHESLPMWFTLPHWLFKLKWRHV